MPMASLPGTTAMRAGLVDQRAMSSERLTTREDFVPRTGSSSKSVMTGPGQIPDMCPFTPKSASTLGEHPRAHQGGAPTHRAPSGPPRGAPEATTAAAWRQDRRGCPAPPRVPRRAASILRLVQAARRPSHRWPRPREFSARLRSRLSRPGQSGAGTATPWTGRCRLPVARKAAASPRAEKRLDADIVEIAFARVRTTARAACRARFPRCCSIGSSRFPAPDAARTGTPCRAGCSGFLLAMQRGREPGAALAAPASRSRCGEDWNPAIFSAAVKALGLLASATASADAAVLGRNPEEQRLDIRRSLSNGGLGNVAFSFRWLGGRRRRQRWLCPRLRHPEFTRPPRGSITRRQASNPARQAPDETAARSGLAEIAGCRRLFGGVPLKGEQEIGGGKAASVPHAPPSENEENQCG